MSSQQRKTWHCACCTRRSISHIWACAVFSQTRLNPLWTCKQNTLVKEHFTTTMKLICLFTWLIWSKHFRILWETLTRLCPLKIKAYSAIMVSSNTESSKHASVFSTSNPLLTLLSPRMCSLALLRREENRFAVISQRYYTVRAFLIDYHWDQLA